jgi:pantothenate kinase
MNEMVAKINKLLDRKDRVIIGIFGIPGSGKSTLATELIHRLSCKSVTLPMDGFHLYKSQLDLLPNSKEAHQRRGAPFTFDPQGLVELLSSVSTSLNDCTAPSFDHSIGDPIPNDIKISSDCRVIIVEGLYLGLQVPIWHDIRQYLDELWMIKIPIEEAMERVANRHVLSGICKDLAQARDRAFFNDRVNAIYILEQSQTPDFVISSESIKFGPE